jgi:hypothetical protein
MAMIRSVRTRQTSPKSICETFFRIRYCAFPVPGDCSNFPLPAAPTIMLAAMQERRGNPRRKMVLPVKVSIGDGAGLAYTLDVTSMGARLGGVQVTFEAGQTVTLIRNGRKASFRVAWIRQVNPKEIHAGIEAMQPLDNFWGVDLTSEQAAKKDVEAMMSLAGSEKK